MLIRALKVVPSHNRLRAALLLQIQCSTSNKNQYDSVDIPNWNLIYHVNISHYLYNEYFAFQVNKDILTPQYNLLNA